jgi:hypothetical protein
VGFLCLVFFFSTMAPFLCNGFFADDSLNSQITLAAASQGMTVLEFALKINREWMSGVGRFYPLGWFQVYEFHALFAHFPLARIAHVILIGLNLGLFSWMVFKKTRSKELALLILPVTASLFQAQKGFDSISSYAPLMPLILLYCAGSTYLQWIYLKTQKVRYWIASVVVFGCGLLTYEILLSFLAILVLQPWIQLRTPSGKPRYKAILKVCTPYFIFSALFIGFTLYLRSKRAFAYEGTEMNWVYKKIFLAYRNQLFSALPLSYFSNHPEITFNEVKEWGFQSIWTHLSVISGMVLFYLGLPLRKPADRSVSISRDVALIGFGFAMLPPLLISLSLRWQNYIRQGQGYLPVYLSFFGVGVLLALLLHFLFGAKWTHRMPLWILKTLKCGLTLGFGAILFINHSTNQAIVEEANVVYKYPRNLIVNAYNHGIADHVLKDSTFVTTQIYQWNNEVLSDKIFGKVKSVVFLPDFTTAKWTAIQSKPIYFLDFAPLDQKLEHKGGWAFLSKVSLDEHAKDTLPSQLAYRFQDPYLFIEKFEQTHPVATLECGLPKMKTVIDPLKETNLTQNEFLIRLNDFKCKMNQLKITLIYL